MHMNTQESNYRSGQLQDDICFTSVTKMANVMKEFFGHRVLKANYIVLRAKRAMYPRGR